MHLDTLVALTTRIPPEGVRRVAGYSLLESVCDGWWCAAQIPSGDAVVMFMTDRDFAPRYRRCRACCGRYGIRR